MERDAGRSRWTLVAVLGGTFMLLVDVTIVQVALPTIQRDLHAGFSGLQWVIDAYALTLAALLLTSGSLADHFGRKRVFVGGVAVFTLASLLCGLATSTAFLDSARALQGVGGAAMFATSLALIGQEFHGRERGTAIALWGSMVGGAVAVGPLIGGAITDALGWEWIFFVNLPVGVAVAAIAGYWTPNVGDPQRQRSDLGGLVTFSAFLFLLVFALLRGNNEGWSSALIVGSLTGAAVLLVLFVWVELRQERPMFDLSLFRNPAFTGVSIGTFAIGAGMFALLPYLTLYLQNVLGYSPFAGGVRLLPATVLIFLVPLVTRNLTGRMPQGAVLGGGLLLVTLGIALMVGLSSSSTWMALLAGMILAGVGIGLCNPSIAQIALGVVPPERTGMASGISNTFRIGGLATGVAALGVVLQDRIGTRLHETRPGASEQTVNAIASGGARGSGVAGHLARSSFVFALNDVFVLAAAIVFAGAVSVFALVRLRPIGHRSS